MTVRKLTDAQKAAVVVIYSSNIRPKSIGDLANCLNVSTRTIGRVIEEAGMIASKKVHTGDTANIMRLLYRNKITIQQLEILLEQTPMSIVKYMTQPRGKATRRSPAAHAGKQFLMPFSHNYQAEFHHE
jgi:hypothetical protein